MRGSCDPTEPRQAASRSAAWFAGRIGGCPVLGVLQARSRDGRSIQTDAQSWPPILPRHFSAWASSRLARRPRSPCRDPLRRRRRQLRVLRPAGHQVRTGSFAKSVKSKRSRGLVRSGDRHDTGEVFALVKANQAHHRVATMCRVLGVSASGYYASRGRGRSRRARRDEELSAMIRRIHDDSDATYGMPRVHAELVEGGCQAGRKRVARLARESGLVGVSRRRGTRTTRSDRDHRAALDRVERQFRADAPNRVWVAGGTYVPTWNGFVYLATVLDVFSRKVVGWAMANHLRTELVLEALNMALAQRRPDGVIHHSDKGAQDTSLAFGKGCRDRGIVTSTGSAGDDDDVVRVPSSRSSTRVRFVQPVGRSRAPDAGRRVAHVVRDPCGRWPRVSTSPRR